MARALVCLLHVHLVTHFSFHQCLCEQPRFMTQVVQTFVEIRVFRQNHPKSQPAYQEYLLLNVDPHIMTIGLEY